MNIKRCVYSVFKISIPLLLFIIGLRYYSLHYPQSIVFMDEGLLVSSTRRVLSQEVPYKDFHLNYGPGIYYLYAGIIKLFNINIFLLGRLWQMLLVSIFSVVIYYISLRVLPRFLAFFAGLYTLFVCRIGYNLGWASPHSFAVLFAFISLLSVLKFYETDKKIYLIFCGSFLGFSALFFYPWAFFSGLAILIHLILQEHFFYKNSDSALKYPLKRIFVNISIVLLSCFAVVLIPGVYFCLQSSLKGFIYELFISQITGLKGQYLATYPGLLFRNYFSFIYLNNLYFPAIIIIVSLIYFLLRFRTLQLDKKDNYAFLFLIFGALTYVYFHVTPAETHLFVILPSFNILGLYLIYRTAAYFFNSAGFASFFTIIKKFILALFILPFIFYYFTAPYTSWWDGKTLSIYWATKYLWSNLKSDNTLLTFLLKERSGEPQYYCPGNFREYKVTEYIKSHTLPSDKIYVFANNPLLYYLADRDNPSKNDHFLVGGEDIKREKEELSYLKADPPKYIIFSPTILTQQSWNRHRILASYILKNYYQIENIGEFLIFAKKPKM